MARMMESTTSPFAFLWLPRELWDLIYRHLLSTRTNYPDEDKNSGDRWPVKFHPAILRVNKQISEEASQVLYLENDSILLRVATQWRNALYNMPNLIGLSAVRIPHPLMEIAVEEFSDGDLLQTSRLPRPRTFIFTAEGFPHFIEILWDKAKWRNFYHSMRFSVFPSKKAPSRRAFLSNHLLKSLDQVQGFAELIFNGEVDAEVVRHLTECMTLGQHLQDTQSNMAELYYVANASTGRKLTLKQSGIGVDCKRSLITVIISFVRIPRAGQNIL